VSDLLVLVSAGAFLVMALLTLTRWTPVRDRVYWALGAISLGALLAAFLWSQP
jgi:hypothetical protein